MAEPRRPSRGPTVRPPAEGDLVLIVDDNADDRRVYGQYLEYFGFRVALAADGEEGIAMAREVGPDIILMDLAMPGLDGIEATRRLKSADDTAGIAIVVLTGHGLGPMRRDAEAAGCDLFLTKPILPSEVCRRLQEVLKSRQRR